MTIAQYAGFVSITFVFVLLILRACYFLFVAKQDPVKTIVPVDFLTRVFNKQQQIKSHKVIRENS